MPDGDHQVINITLAGVRAPRTSTKQGEASEPWGEEVRPLDLLLMRRVDKTAAKGKILYRVAFASTLSPRSAAVPADIDGHSFPNHCQRISASNCKRLHWFRFVLRKVISHEVSSCRSCF